jgi:hypothetical protein
MNRELAYQLAHTAKKVLNLSLTAGQFWKLKLALMDVLEAEARK